MRVWALVTKARLRLCTRPIGPSTRITTFLCVSVRALGPTIASTCLLHRISGLGCMSLSLFLLPSLSCSLSLLLSRCLACSLSLSLSLALLCLLRRISGQRVGGLGFGHHSTLTWKMLAFHDPASDCVSEPTRELNMPTLVQTACVLLESDEFASTRLLLRSVFGFTERVQGAACREAWGGRAWARTSRQRPNRGSLDALRFTVHDELSMARVRGLGFGRAGGKLPGLEQAASDRTEDLSMLHGSRSMANCPWQGFKVEG